MNYLLINQSCMVALLCIGFTFTLSMEKFPNFAHLTIAGWGSVFMFTLVAYLGLSPLAAVPFATLLSGLLGVLLYLLVVRPLRRHGGFRDVTLTLAFLGVSWVLRSFSLIYSYWTNVEKRVSSRGFRVGGLDFTLFGVPGPIVMGLLASVALVALMYLFLSRNRVGVALRAVAEDENLAAAVGIDTLKMHIASWMLTGALAGFAGAMMSMGGGGGADTDTMLVIVMAGSFLGGINSVFGAALGGFSIMFVVNSLPGIAEGLVGNYRINILGNYFDLYRLTALVPYVVMYGILLFEPEGIVGIAGRVRGFVEKVRNGRSVGSA